MVSPPRTVTLAYRFADPDGKEIDLVIEEGEKAKEALKQQVVALSIRTAEKILRQKLDDPAQRKLAGEFIDEVGALR